MDRLYVQDYIDSDAVLQDKLLLVNHDNQQLRPLRLPNIDSPHTSTKSLNQKTFSTKALLPQKSPRDRLLGVKGRHVKLAAINSISTRK